MIIKSYLVLSSLFLATLIYSSCGNNANSSSIPKVENSSENEKAISDVTIGKQVWMAKNLSVDKFRNGDPITQAKTQEEWEKSGLNKQPAWCYYDNDPANGIKYGKLYNWYAVNDPRGLAPKNYHIPSDAEWIIFLDFLDIKIAGKKIKTTEGWKYNGNGNNETGFSALPGGNRGGSYGLFGSISITGYWWSSTEGSNDNVWFLGLNCHYDDASRSCGDKPAGFSVRCLKD